MRGSKDKSGNQDQKKQDSGIKEAQKKEDLYFEDEVEEVKNKNVHKDQMNTKEKQFAQSTLKHQGVEKKKKTDTFTAIYDQFIQKSKHLQLQKDDQSGAAEVPRTYFKENYNLLKKRKNKDDETLKNKLLLEFQSKLLQLKCPPKKMETLKIDFMHHVWQSQRKKAYQNSIDNQKQQSKHLKPIKEQEEELNISQNRVLQNENKQMKKKYSKKRETQSIQINQENISSSQISQKKHGFSQFQNNEKQERNQIKEQIIIKVNQPQEKMISFSADQAQILSINEFLKSGQSHFRVCGEKQDLWKKSEEERLFIPRQTIEIKPNIIISKKKDEYYDKLFAVQKKQAEQIILIEQKKKKRINNLKDSSSSENVLPLPPVKDRGKYSMLQTEDIRKMKSAVQQGDYIYGTVTDILHRREKDGLYHVQIFGYEGPPVFMSRDQLCPQMVKDYEQNRISVKKVVAQWFVNEKEQRKLKGYWCEAFGETGIFYAVKERYVLAGAPEKLQQFLTVKPPQSNKSPRVKQYKEDIEEDDDEEEEENNESEYSEKDDDDEQEVKERPKLGRKRKQRKRKISLPNAPKLKNIDRSRSRDQRKKK